VQPSLRGSCWPAPVGVAGWQQLAAAPDPVVSHGVCVPDPVVCVPHLVCVPDPVVAHVGSRRVARIGHLAWPTQHLLWRMLACAGLPLVATLLTHAYAHARMRTHTHTYSHTYTHIHKHTYTQTQGYPLSSHYPPQAELLEAVCASALVVFNCSSSACQTHPMVSATSDGWLWFGPIQVVCILVERFLVDPLHPLATVRA